VAAQTTRDERRFETKAICIVHSTAGRSAETSQTRMTNAADGSEKGDVLPVPGTTVFGE